MSDLSQIIEGMNTALAVLRAVSKTAREFTELARSCQARGNDAGAKAFFSCAARIEELLQPIRERSAP